MLSLNDVLEFTLLFVAVLVDVFTLLLTAVLVEVFTLLFVAVLTL